MIAEAVSGRFDHVLVDEYQDTNKLQSSVLLAMRPEGHGLTVVGDDAQSIYSFRAATVRNILDFPDAFTPAADMDFAWLSVMEMNGSTTTRLFSSRMGS